MVPPLRHYTSTASSLAFSRDSQHKPVWRQEVGGRRTEPDTSARWRATFTAHLLARDPQHPSAPSTCIKGTVHQKWIFRPFHTHLDDDQRSGDFSNPQNSSGVSQREIIPPNGKRKYIRLAWCHPSVERCDSPISLEPVTLTPRF